MTLPYMQRIVSDYLRANTGVLTITNRVVAEPPEDTVAPWVMVRQLNATNAGTIPVEHLIDFMFQFDCYVGKGEGMPQAFNFGHKVRDALTAMSGTIQSGTTISAVKITGDLPLPDTDLKPARLRKIITATIWAHG